MILRFKLLSDWSYEAIEDTIHNANAIKIGPIIQQDDADLCVGE